LGSVISEEASVVEAEPLAGMAADGAVGLVEVGAGFEGEEQELAAEVAVALGASVGASAEEQDQEEDLALGNGHAVAGEAIVDHALLLRFPPKSSS